MRSFLLNTSKVTIVSQLFIPSMMFPLRVKRRPQLAPLTDRTYSLQRALVLAQRRVLPWRGRFYFLLLSVTGCRLAAVGCRRQTCAGRGVRGAWGEVGGLSARCLGVPRGRHNASLTTIQRIVTPPPDRMITICNGSCKNLL